VHGGSISISMQYAGVQYVVCGSVARNLVNII
jgi:hypothetical protein